MEELRKAAESLKNLGERLGAEKEKRMNRVYICSQYGTRGERENNLELAKMFCMQAIEAGECPVCPHLFYAQVLNDAVESQREQGRALGMELLKICDSVRVCSRLSEGMKAEIAEAWRREIPVEVMNMKNLYSPGRAEEIEQQIREDLEALYGKEHHSKAYR